MADNLTTQSATPATVPSASVIATDDVAGVHYQRVKLVDGTLDGTGAIGGDATNGLDVDVTRVQGTVTVSGPLTDAQLRATPVPVSGTVTITDGAGAVTVDGTVAVSSVAGTVTTDGSGVTQPVSAASLPLPTGASTAAKQPALGTAGTASADVISVQGIASMTALKVDGSAVTQPVSGTVTVQDGGNVISVDDNGSTLSIDDGGGSITIDGSVSLTGTNTVTQTPATSGGTSIYSFISLGTSSDSVNVKASAGQLYGWVITNTNAAVRYVKLYNSASGPTAGSGAPVLRLMIPGNTAGAGLVAAEFVSGIAFSSGIGHTIVTGSADSSSTACGAGDVIINLLYK